MTRFTMRQPWFTIGDDLVVKDAAGEVAYKVDGKLLSFRSVATIYDRQGRAVVKVREVLLSIDPATVLERDGVLLATVKRTGSASNLKERYSVELADGNILRVSDRAFREYRVDRDASCIASIVKAPTGVRDSYDIEVTEGEDQGLILGIAIALRQMARHKSDSA